MKDQLTKIELKFWIPIIATAITMTIAWSTLSNNVDRVQSQMEDMTSREQLNKGAFKELIEVVHDMNDRLIRIECAVSPTTCL